MAKSKRYYCKAVVRDPNYNAERIYYFRVYIGTPWLADSEIKELTVEQKVGIKTVELTMRFEPEIGIIYERGVLVSDEEECGTHVTFEEGHRYQKVVATCKNWQNKLPIFLNLD